MADKSTPPARVDRILAAQRAGDAATVATVAKLEAEIDAHVYRLHGLTPAGLALVEVHG